MPHTTLSPDRSPRTRGRTVGDIVGSVGINRYCIVLLVGYGLFKTLMDLTYTTAVSTIENTFVLIGNLPFSIVSSFFIMLTSAVLAVASWTRPRTNLDAPALAALVLLACVNLTPTIGLLDQLPAQVVSMALPAVYGITAIVANTAWLVPFAGLKPRRCLVCLSLGMLIGSVGTMAVGLLPAVSRPWALLAIGLASAVLYGCHMILRAERVRQGKLPAPGSEPCATVPQEARKRQIADAVSYLASPFLVYAIIGLILGLVTSFQLANEEQVAGGPSLRNLAAAVTYLLVVCLGLFARGMPSIRKMFGRACPVIALILVALPFVGPTYSAYFTSALTAFNAFASASMLFLLLEYAHAARLPIAAAVGAITFLSRLILLVGLGAGAALGAQTNMDLTVRSLIVTVVAIYLLMLIMVSFARTKRWSFRSDAVSLYPEGDGAPAASRAERAPRKRPGVVMPGGEEPEGVLAAVELQSAQRNGDAAGVQADTLPERATPGTAAPDAPDDARAPEPYERCARNLGARYRLTVREQEVLLLLARGRSATYIGSELGLTTSTVRSYTKNLYAKLDVHSKQELIDLFSDDYPV